MAEKRDQGSQTDFEAAERNVAGALEEGKQSATRALHDIRDDLGQRTSDIAAEAKDATVRKVEEAQHGVGAGLASLGGALHAASDHLAEQEQGTASKLLQETADGIERLAYFADVSSTENSTIAPHMSAMPRRRAADSAGDRGGNVNWRKPQ